MFLGPHTHAWLGLPELKYMPKVIAFPGTICVTCCIAVLAISWKPPGDSTFSWVHPDYLYTPPPLVTVVAQSNLSAAFTIDYGFSGTIQFDITVNAKGISQTFNCPDSPSSLKMITCITPELEPATFYTAKVIGIVSIGRQPDTITKEFTSAPR
jgi:hypothetical protein